MYALVEDAAGALWFGTSVGLGRWLDGQWRQWTRSDGLRSNRLFTIAVGCTLDCFGENQATINEIVDSWLVNTR